jgi:hypothetical protein
MATHFLLSSICCALLGFWLGLGGQFVFFVFGGIPSMLISHVLDRPRYKARYEDASAIFLSGAVFSMLGGYLAMMLGGLLCYFNGDPNADHYAGSLFSVVAGVFCVLEAVVYSYLEVRWAQ